MFRCLYVGTGPQYQEFQRLALRQRLANLALRDALRPIAERHGTSVSSVAIAWTLSWPGVTAAIVGARAPKQVDDRIDAAAVPLTSPDLAEIASAVERTGAGTGPVRADGPAGPPRRADGKRVSR